MSYDEKKEWFLIILGLLIGVPLIFGAFGIVLIDYLKLLYANLDEFIPWVIFLVVIFGGISIIGRVIDSFSKSKSRPRTNGSKDYPDNWNESSQQVKKRDGYRCGNCGSTTNLHVHHIVPLSKGGTNNINNLRTLCEEYHKLLHPHMQ